MIKCKNITKEKPCIGIFSPSEPLTDTRKERFQKGIDYLKSKGFIIKFGDHIFDNEYYMAGSAKIRAKDIAALVKNPSVDILMASWGGKSCNQILRFLEYELIKHERKPILGFSDGCVVTNAITAKTDLVTFCGPNVAGKSYETKHTNLEILFTEHFNLNTNLLGNINEIKTETIVPGSCKGRLIGGNLSTFVLGLVGSEFMPKFEDCIFFWESAGETTQIIDQFLTCLINAKFFESVRGMIIGDFIREDSESYKNRNPFEMLKDVFGHYDYPILHCPTFGHLSNLENPIFPIGAQCHKLNDMVYCSYRMPECASYDCA